MDADSASEARQYFELCDVEHEQRVSRQQFARLADSLRLSPERLERIFDSLDSDSSGYLTLQDFIRAVDLRLLQHDSFSPPGHSLNTQTGNDTNAHADEDTDVSKRDADHSPANGLSATSIRTLLHGPFDNCRHTIEEMWNGLQRHSPALLPQFESFIEQLTKQIRVNQDETDQLDSAAQRSAANRDRNLQKLRQAIEFHVHQQRQEVIRHVQKQQNLLQSELGKELHRKESRICGLESEQSELMARLREMKQCFVSSQSKVLSNQNDQDESDSKSTHATQPKISSKISQIDEREWLTSAIKIDQQVAVERESLIRQLEILHELNQKWAGKAHENESNSRDEAKVTKEHEWEAVRRKLLDEVPALPKTDGVGTRVGLAKLRSFSDPRLRTTLALSAEIERMEEKTHRCLSLGDESKGFEQHYKADQHRRMMSIYESEKSYHYLEMFAANHRRRSHVGSEVDLHQPKNLLTVGQWQRAPREEREIKDAVDVEMLASGFREAGDVQLIVPAYFQHSFKKTSSDLAAQTKLVDASVATDECEMAKRDETETSDAVRDNQHQLLNRGELEQAGQSTTKNTPNDLAVDALSTRRREHLSVGDGSSVFDLSTTVAQNTDRFFKIILLGDSNVGKTTLIYRIATGMFKSGFKATVGVDFITRHFELPEGAADAVSNSVLKQNVQFNRTEKFVPVGVQFWDTAGMERYRAISRQYFKKSDGAILLYDVTSARSFVSLRGWLEMLQDATDEGASDNVTILLCASKVDLVEADQSLRAVSTQTAKQLAEPFGAMYAEISARNGTNVDEAIYNLLCEIKRKDDKRIRDAADGNFTVGTLNDKKKKNCCS